MVEAVAAGRVASLVMGPDDPGTPPRHWARSLATAVGARVVARHLGAHPDDAYAAGMLHHVGDLVLYRRDPQRHAEAQAAATPPHGRGPVWDREAEVFGRSHLEMGVTVMRDWLLPDRIVAAVREHHAQPEALASTLSRAVWLGARIGAAAAKLEPLDGLSVHAACLAAGLDGQHRRLRDEIDGELAAAVGRVAGFASTQPDGRRP